MLARALNRSKFIEFVSFLFLSFFASTFQPRRIITRNTVIREFGVFFSRWTVSSVSGLYWLRRIANGFHMPTNRPRVLVTDIGWPFSNLQILLMVSNAASFKRKGSIKVGVIRVKLLERNDERMKESVWGRWGLKRIECKENNKKQLPSPGVRDCPLEIEQTIV